MHLARSARALARAALVAALAACHTSAVAPVPRTAMTDTALIRRDITYLASEALEGRAPGTPGNDSAAAYIARLYLSLHLERANIPVSTPPVCPAAFSEGFDCAPMYMQRFFARSVAAAHAGLPGAIPTQNVVAVIPGSDPALRHEYVLIGAHYDHLGRSAFNAMDPSAGDAIRPGADDNASGTAAVMELARLFANHPTRRSIMVLNFSGEELGDLGSAYFVAHSPIPLDSAEIYINFDMVGRLRDDKLIVLGAATATQLKPLLDSLNDSTRRFALSAGGDGYGPSDHASFYAAGVPVLHFFTDQHEDYHRATDVASKINFVGEARVIDYAAAVARELGDRPGRLTYVSAPPPKQTMMGGGAWFGSVPDMGAVDVTGVRLAGVTAGSPADKAGAMKGDIIVEFGGAAVKDIYDYSAALGKHHPGDTVTVVVVRDGKRITLSAVLGTRGS